MATTSKGLRYPVAADSVAIHTDLQNLATDVDTRLNQSVATTKGDLVVYDGTSEVRLGVGTNGQLLQADSSTSSGVKWAKDFTTASSASGLISKYIGSGSETSVLFTSIPQTYTNLDLVGSLVFVGPAASQNTLIKVLINGTEIQFCSMEINRTLQRAEVVAGLEFANVETSLDLRDAGIIRIVFPNYSSSAKFKNVIAQTSVQSGITTAGSFGISFASGTYRSTSAITSIEIKQENLYSINSNSYLSLYGNFGG
jgi:hypothetical protein